jgi:hypothetical protein
MMRPRYRKYPPEPPGTPGWKWFLLGVLVLAVIVVLMRG